MSMIERKHKEEYNSFIKLANMRVPFVLKNLQKY